MRSTSFYGNTKLIPFRRIYDTADEPKAHNSKACEVNFIPTASNGYYKISYNGQTGYALSQYLN
jgi:hypothetical protein